MVKVKAESEHHKSSSKKALQENRGDTYDFSFDISSSATLQSH